MLEAFPGTLLRPKSFGSKRPWQISAPMTFIMMKQHFCEENVYCDRMRSFLPLFLGAVTAVAQPSDTYDPGKQLEAHRPVRAVTDPGVVTTRQSITPAGVPTVFNGRVYAVAFGSSASEMWVLNATNVFRLDWRTNKILDRIALGGTPGLQSLQWDSSTGRALASAVVRASGVQLLGF